MVKKPHYNRDNKVKLIMLVRGMYREWKKIEFPQKILYMNLETMRLRGRPRNRWQDEVREDGRLVGGKGCKERVYNREECTRILRMARNHHILHKPVK